MAQGRGQEIVKVSLRGIGVNLLLVVFKAAVGLAAHSIAVILDAVNNLSDVLSSVITIVGTKLAGKKADRKHPYGHGRVEYISAMAVAVIVLLAGVTSLRESVIKIIHPEEASYTALSALILAAGVAAKIFLGLYFRKRGGELTSESLTASGTDALFDAVIGAATLVSAILNMLLGWNLEGILGAVISLFIIRAGIEIMQETLSLIIGVRADAELTEQMKEVICAHEEVQGAYDLILHSYGPETHFASVHVELDDSMSVRECDKLMRRITMELYERFRVITTIGLYATNTHSEAARTIKAAVQKEIAAHPEIMQLHGFYLEDDTNQVSFDVIMDFGTENPGALAGEITGALQTQFPDYHFTLNIDRDFSEELTE